MNVCEAGLGFANCTFQQVEFGAPHERLKVIGCRMRNQRTLHGLDTMATYKLCAAQGRVSRELAEVVWRRNENQCGEASCGVMEAAENNG